jgi:hypothetical protein
LNAVRSPTWVQLLKSNTFSRAFLTQRHRSVAEKHMQVNRIPLWLLLQQAAKP